MTLRLILTDGAGVQGLTATFGAFINTTVPAAAASAAAAAASAAAALNSQNAAASSASQASTNATAAGVSASSAAGSATAAAGSASSASASASSASASATAASGSATSAGTSASAASASASAAAGSATAAATSASNAAATLANALVKTNNLSDVSNAATALSNIGGLAKTANLSDVANVTTARGNLSAAKSGVNSDITSLTGLTTPLPISEGGTGASTASGGLTNLGGLPFGFVGQCRFDFVSATQCKLSRYNGKSIVIGTTQYDIPSAGVTLSNSGLGANVLYFVYAFINAGAITLEASTTLPIFDTTTGNPIKTGDSSRTVVGMVYTSSASQFFLNSNAGGGIGVLSYFNRKPKEAEVSTAVNFQPPGDGGYYPNSNTLLYGCRWSDEVVSHRVMGTCNAVANGIFSVACYIGAAPNVSGAIGPGTGGAVGTQSITTGFAGSHNSIEDWTTSATVQAYSCSVAGSPAANFPSMTCKIVCMG